MAKKGNGTSKNGQTYQSKEKPKSPALFERGIRSHADAITASFAAAADVGFGRMPHGASNAMASHVRNAIKIVEASYKYGRSANGQPRNLFLT